MQEEVAPAMEDTKLPMHTLPKVCGVNACEECLWGNREPEPPSVTLCSA